MKRKVLVLGAGICGLSAAWHLQKQGINCVTFEKEKEVGGLCRSKVKNGFIFDYDGHLLHFKNKSIFKLVKGLLENNLKKHKRNSWVYHYGCYGRYPFQANLYGMPASVVKDCIEGFLASSENNNSEKKFSNFLDWSRLKLGSGITKHFVKPYNEKFWTVPCNQLTCEWLDGFVAVPTWQELLEGTFRPSRREFGYNAYFYYPKRGGINQLPLALASKIRNINTASAVKEIDLKRKEVRTFSGRKEKYDFLVSTIPLPEIACLIREIDLEYFRLFKNLKWNSILNINLGIQRKGISSRHWVYFPGKETCFFRAGFPSSFSQSLVPSGKSSLYIEIAYSENKPLPKNNIVEDCIDSLKKLSILKSGDEIITKDINNIKYAYPIFDKNYLVTRKKLLNYLKDRSIISCGRYGSWKYLSMEGAILEGIRAAEEVSGLFCLR